MGDNVRACKHSLSLISLLSFFTFRSKHVFLGLCKARGSEAEASCASWRIGWVEDLYASDLGQAASLSWPLRGQLSVVDNNRPLTFLPRVVPRELPFQLEEQRG